MKEGKEERKISRSEGTVRSIKDLLPRSSIREREEENMLYLLQSVQGKKKK